MESFCFSCVFLFTKSWKGKYSRVIAVAHTNNATPSNRRCIGGAVPRQKLWRVLVPSCSIHDTPPVRVESCRECLEFKRWESSVGYICLVFGFVYIKGMTHMLFLDQGGNIGQFHVGCLVPSFFLARIPLFLLGHNDIFLSYLSVASDPATHCARFLVCTKVSFTQDSRFDRFWPCDCKIRPIDNIIAVCCYSFD